MKFSESVVERKNFWLLILHLDFTDFFFSLLSFIFLLYILVLLPRRNLSIWLMTLMFNCARLAFAVPAFAAPHQVWLAPCGSRGAWTRQEGCFMALSNPAAQKLRKNRKRDAAETKRKWRLSDYGGDCGKIAEIITWLLRHCASKLYVCSVTPGFSLSTDMHLDSMRAVASHQ